MNINITNIEKHVQSIMIGREASWKKNNQSA